MIERFFGPSPVGDDAEAFCAVRADALVGEAARVLVLTMSGVCLSETDYQLITDRLAAVAELHGASPEVMQAALYDLEPDLDRPPLLRDS